MLPRLFLVLAALLGPCPAIAVTLAHPDSPIFKACAADMNVSSEAVAERILSVGWTEANLTTELQNLGRDYLELSNFEPSVYFGQTTKEDWDASIAELSDIRGIDPYDSDPKNELGTLRVFENQDGSGFVVLSSEPDGFWTCEILLTVASEGASQFMANPPSNDDRQRTEGIIYMSDEYRMIELAELIGLLPFMPTPKHYYTNYLLAEPDTIEQRFGHSVRLVFAAEISVAFPF